MSWVSSDVKEHSNLAEVEDTVRALSLSRVRHTTHSTSYSAASPDAQHNAGASVNRVPPEVLAVIFEHVGAPCIKPPRQHRDYIRGQGHFPLESLDREPALRAPDHRSLISVTHVCRRWRTIAVEFPLLWAHIVAHSRGALTFAQRAQGAPVTAHAKVSAGRLPKRAKNVMRLVHPQTRALVLHLEELGQFRIFAKTLEALAPQLESLAIVIHGSRGLFGAGVANVGVVSPLLFGGKASALRELHIISSRVLIPTDLFPRLASCRMHFEQGFSAWDDFAPRSVEFLSRAPRLSRFSLRMTNGHSIDLPAVPRVLALPHLRDVRISTCCLNAATELFNFLSIAMGSSDIPGADDVEPGPILDPESIVVVRHPYHSTILGRPRTARQLQATLSSDTSLRCYVRPRPAPLRDALLAQAKRLYLVHSIDCGGGCGQVLPSPGSLSDMPRLGTIVMYSGPVEYARPFLDRLGVELTRRDPVLCPSLRTLICVVEGRWARRWAVSAPTQLLDAVARREELGHPFQLIVCDPPDVVSAQGSSDYHSDEEVPFRDVAMPDINDVY